MLNYVFGYQIEAESIQDIVKKGPLISISSLYTFMRE